jgi:hypothetical protein
MTGFRLELRAGCANTWRAFGKQRRGIADRSSDGADALVTDGDFANEHHDEKACDDRAESGTPPLQALAIASTLEKSDLHFEPTSC